MLDDKCLRAREISVYIFPPSAICLSAAEWEEKHFPSLGSSEAMNGNPCSRRSHRVMSSMFFAVRCENQTETSPPLGRAATRNDSADWPCRRSGNGNCSTRESKYLASTTRRKFIYFARVCRPCSASFLLLKRAKMIFQLASVINSRRRTETRHARLRVPVFFPLSVLSRR